MRLATKKMNLAAVAVAVAAMTGHAGAAVHTWTNTTTNGDWNVPANWDATNGAPPTTNNATVVNVTGTRTNSTTTSAFLSSNLDADYAINRLNMGGIHSGYTLGPSSNAVAYAQWQVGGASRTLTLNGDGTTANIAIFNDSSDTRRRPLNDAEAATAGPYTGGHYNVNHVVSTGVNVSTSQTWRNNGDGTISFSGPVSIGANNVLTLDGTAAGSSGSSSTGFEFTSTANAPTAAAGGTLVLRRTTQFVNFTTKNTLRDVYITNGKLLGAQSGGSNTVNEIIANNAVVTVESDRGFDQVANETVGTFYANHTNAIRLLSGRLSLGTTAPTTIAGGTVVVGANGKLGGTTGFGTNGYSGAPVIVSGGTISPGDPRNGGLYTQNKPVVPFVLNRHNDAATTAPILSFEAGTYDWDIRSVTGGLASALNQAQAGTNWDVIRTSFTGTSTAANAAFAHPTDTNTFTINIANLTSGATLGFDPTLDYKWLIVDAASATNAFDASRYLVNTASWTAGIGADRRFFVTWDSASSDLFLEYAVVPEPTTLGLLGLGAVLGLRRRRDTGR